MFRSVLVSALTVACSLGVSVPLGAEESRSAAEAPRMSSIVQSALRQAWTPAAAATASASVQRSQPPAGPNIGAVGLGGVAGLSEFEIGPSFRYWITDRIGVQAHLGFSGDDFFDDDVEYLRFEPTVIVAIGDFGNDALNVRPYAGGGLRVQRTDIGSFSDTDVLPSGVGGVEFGFRGVPRLKVSAELSLSAETDVDDFDPRDPPELGGVRLAGLVHYFFD